MESDLSVSTARRRRSFNKLYIIAGSLCALLLLLIVGISLYVSYTLIHPYKVPIKAPPESWGVFDYQNVEFESNDGVTLRGWLFPAQSNDYLVVQAHGYSNNRSMNNPSIPITKALLEQGVSVLMFDFRNSGDSDGNTTTVGAMEQYDLIAAVKYSESQGYGSKGIGLIGYSMGASTALVAAAQLPEVTTVVADSPFADLDKYLRQNVSYWSGLPDFPFTPLILYEIAAMSGHKLSEVAPIHKTNRLRDRNILFIHGDSDDQINNATTKEMVRKLDNGSELWNDPKARHVETYDLHPEEYVQRVTDYFMKHLQEKNA